MMVNLFKLLVASLPTLAAAGSFCATHGTPEFRAQALKFAAQDAKDFPGQLNAAGTNFVAPSTVPRGGATLDGLIKKLKLNWDVPNKKWIFIKTYVHVVADSKKYEDGWVSDKAIVQQLVAMNLAYAPHYISFITLGVDRTINPEWANFTDPYGPSDLAKRKALRRGDYKTLNIYITKVNPFDSVGSASFPEPAESVPPGSDLFYFDGVNVRYDTLPGGRYPYDEGKTAVHEIGHWLFLAHVFEDSINCQGLGDLVADTPVQKDSTGEGDGVPVGCPIGKDSCPNLPGLDSVTNYMDYTDDSCLTEFTIGQRKRMHEQWYTFRDIKPRAQWYN